MHGYIDIYIYYLICMVNNDFFCCYLRKLKILSKLFKVCQVYVEKESELVESLDKRREGSTGQTPMVITRDSIINCIWICC